MCLFLAFRANVKKFLRHVILYYGGEVHIIMVRARPKNKVYLGCILGCKSLLPQCLRRKREMCHLCHLERYVYVFFTLRAAGRCAPNGRPMRAALTGDVRRADYQG